MTYSPKWLKQLWEKSDALMDKYAEDPFILDDIPDESDEFLSPEVGQLLAEWRTGHFDFRSLFRLSTAKRQAFCQAVKEEWGIEITVDLETFYSKNEGC